MSSRLLQSGCFGVFKLPYPIESEPKFDPAPAEPTECIVNSDPLNWTTADPLYSDFNSMIAKNRIGYRFRTADRFGTGAHD